VTCFEFMDGQDILVQFVNEYKGGFLGGELGLGFE
jgi:hypothetical protein